MSLTTVHHIQPWEFERLLVDFSTTDNATPQATGLAFTPAANTRYWIRGAFFVKSTSTTVAPNLGASWPTGTTFTCGRMQMAQSRNAADPSTRNYGATAAGVTGGTAIDVANEGYWGRFEGSLVTGATPSGDFEITLQVESGGVATATLMAGSNLQWWPY